MQTLDLIVFLAYMGGITLFGASFYSRDKSSSTFTLGNSNFPTWVVTMSIFATFVSSISFLGLPGNAYQTNWNAFVFSLSIPVASLMAVQFFVPLYRKLNSPSAYVFLETKFGLWARVYVSACYLLTQMMRIGTILYLLALPVNALFGWDILTIIAITGLVVMGYSLLGGIQAVMWRDAIQGIVLIGGALVCLLYIAFSMPEGPGQIMTIALENDKFSLGSFGSSLTESTFWVVLIYGIFINLQNYGIDQNYVQRYMASRSDAEAKRSAPLGRNAVRPRFLAVFPDRYGAFFLLHRASRCLARRTTRHFQKRPRFSLFHRGRAAARTDGLAHRFHFCGGNEYHLYQYQQLVYRHFGRLFPAIFQNGVNGKNFHAGTILHYLPN